METISIIMNPSSSYGSRLCDRLSMELAHLHKGKSTTIVNWQSYGSYAQITVETKAPNKAIEAISAALTDHIVQDEALSLLKGIVTREYQFYEAEELNSILQYCLQYLHEGAELPESKRSELRRKGKIKSAIRHCLNQHKFIDLNGFIRFRLREYAEELRDVVEYAIDEFMLERQYKEFISLIKYFVYLQEAKIPAVHLIHKGGQEFSILNEALHPIDLSCYESSLTVEFIDKEINFEDMIVSTLITVSPGTIYIHTREPEEPVIKTIIQIFEDRTRLCSHCSICNLFEGLLRY